MLPRTGQPPPPGATMATEKDLLLARIPAGSPVPPALALMPDGPRVLAPTFAATPPNPPATHPASPAVVPVPITATPEPSAAPPLVLIAPQVEKPKVSPGVLLETLAKYLTASKQPVLNISPEAHLVTRGMLAEGNGYVVITPKGIGYLVDLGVL